LSFEDGVRLFNEREFWHAHEAWEELWLEADDDDLVLFYQGLIQLAAAYHHMKRGTFSGAVRLFDAATQKLEPFPPDFLGLDRSDAVKSAQAHREFALRGEFLDQSDYPKLQFHHPI
jgi:predicted metal-dependent hydrolase